MRGHRIYRCVWRATVDEQLECKPEPRNKEDPYAVAVMKNDEVVGHVPRKISAACTLFIKKRGIILHCHRKKTLLLRSPTRWTRSTLCLPVSWQFRTGVKNRLLVSKSSSVDENVPECPSSKRRKTDNSNTSLTPDSVWKVLNGYELSQADKSNILSGGRLNDKHINFAR